AAIDSRHLPQLLAELANPEQKAPLCLARRLRRLSDLHGTLERFSRFWGQHSVDDPDLRGHVLPSAGGTHRRGCIDHIRWTIVLRGLSRASRYNPGVGVG